MLAPNGNNQGFSPANVLKMNLQGRNTVVVVSNFYVVSSKKLEAKMSHLSCRILANTTSHTFHSIDYSLCVATQQGYTNVHS